MGKLPNQTATVIAELRFDMHRAFAHAAALQRRSKHDTHG